MKKYSMLYLCLFASLSLMSCSQDENMLSENNNDDKEFLVTVDFSVSGIADYGESNQPTTRSAASPVTKVIPLNEDFEAEVTLTPDVPVQTRSAAPKVMADGVRFRVLAYRKGKLDAQLEYQIEGSVVKPIVEGATFQLINDTYTFVAYSYNNNLALPAFVEGTSLAVNIDNDFLYWTKEITLNSLEVKLPIVFSHLFPQFKVKLDTSELLGLNALSASAILQAVTNGSYIHNTGTWNPLSGEFTRNYEDRYEPLITFSETELLKSHEYVFSSNPVSLCPIKTKNLKLIINAQFGLLTEYHASDITQVINNAEIIIGQHTFMPACSYTCVVKIRTSNFNATSLGETSTNSYLFHPGYVATVKTNYYTFPVDYEGQSNDALGTTVGEWAIPYKAVVLWQEVDPVESEIPLIPGVRYLREERKMLIAVHPKLEGNAVVALLDINDEVMWSWHIWSSFNFGYFNSGLAPINLGATTNKPEGLLYQYGRKDPLMQGAATYPTPAGVTDKETYLLGVRNPDSFILNWSQAGNLWQGNTHKNNPCPFSQRVASATELKNAGITEIPNGFIDSDGTFKKAQGGFWTNERGKVYTSDTGEPIEKNQAAAYRIRCYKY